MPAYAGGNASGGVPKIAKPLACAKIRAQLPARCDRRGSSRRKPHPRRQAARRRRAARVHSPACCRCRRDRPHCRTRRARQIKCDHAMCPAEISIQLSRESLRRRRVAWTRTMVKPVPTDCRQAILPASVSMTFVSIGSILDRDDVAGGSGLKYRRRKRAAALRVPDAMQRAGGGIADPGSSKARRIERSRLSGHLNAAPRPGHDRRADIWSSVRVSPRFFPSGHKPAARPAAAGPCCRRGRSGHSRRRLRSRTARRRSRAWRSASACSRTVRARYRS